MLADDAPEGNADVYGRYYLWRMLIDSRFQRRGYGRAALDLVVAYVKTRPGAEVLVTCVVPGDGSPLGFYDRYGFRDTGEMFDHERVLELRLEALLRSGIAVRVGHGAVAGQTARVSSSKAAEIRSFGGRSAVSS
jgi:diamine N-acetyltransferase